MKPIKAWAVIENGKLVARDYRLPLMWYRKPALEDMADYSINWQIIRVEVREVKRRKK